MKNINDLLDENRQKQDSENQNNDSEVKIQKAPDLESEKKEQKQKSDESDKILVSEEKTEEALEDKINELKSREREDELKNKASKMGLGFVNLKGVPVPAETLSRISEKDVEEKKVVCFYYADHNLARLATTQREPEVLEKLKDEFKKQLGVEIEIYLTSEESFNEILKQYSALPKIKEIKTGVEINAEDLEKFSNQLNSLEEIGKMIKEVSMTELVTLIIAAGLKVEASDIHIEAEADGIKLRYRIDGLLHTAHTLEKEVWQKLVSRLKLLSNLKLNITDVPQDGRFSIFTKDEKVDVRISTLPTNFGESVVMRLLMSSRVAELSFEDLGLEVIYREKILRQIGRPNGMIITTGPTGSGKTTTLYGILNKLNTSETKIITIEDPVEYELKGVNQSQVDKKKDYTFAKGLKSIVRQDPDIIMVGEMRDTETVDIALNAALTGHLVLSTLHTNDASGTIPRFLAMGAKPYLLAPALNLVIAQRLVRKLCDKCKQEVELNSEKKNKIKELMGNVLTKEKIDFENLKIFKAGKCEECNNLGYKGRVGVFEMFEMTSEIEQIILSNEISEYKIREIAVKDGMISMMQYGILKVLKGETSLEEVERVIGS